MINLWKTQPSPPAPPSPESRKSAGLGKAAQGGTLPQPLENASRFPQPIGYGYGCFLLYSLRKEDAQF